MIIKSKLLSFYTCFYLCTCYENFDKFMTLYSETKYLRSSVEQSGFTCKMLEHASIKYL